MSSIIAAGARLQNPVTTADADAAHQGAHEILKFVLHVARKNTVRQTFLHTLAHAVPSNVASLLVHSYKGASWFTLTHVGLGIQFNGW